MIQLHSVLKKTPSTNKQGYDRQEEMIGGLDYIGIGKDDAYQKQSVFFF